MWNRFYGPHRRANNPLYNDDCIFTPAVKIFKSDTVSPELLEENSWWEVDVITCAAPNLRNSPSNQMNPYAGNKKTDISREELRALYNSRIQKIFEVAIANRTEILILGAFGCGAFRNPPELIVEVFAKYTKEYQDFFEVIEYAVYHTERDKINYEVFKSKILSMKGHNTYERNSQSNS